MTLIAGCLPSVPDCTRIFYVTASKLAEFRIFVALQPTADDMTPDFLSPFTFEFCLLTLFALSALIQLLYFWIIFSRLAFYKRKPLPSQRRPVSVVVCARNEYRNLKKNLPTLLDQIYDDFEVVVVNDSSGDDTDYLLKSFADQYPRLKVVHFRQHLNFFSGKKFPLSIGIKSATHEHLLLTDADCRPNSPYWIREMQSCFREGTDLVLGYGRYEAGKGMLNRLIRFDTVYVAMQYLSYAMAGLPYMGVGRNIAYKKSLFYKAGGFVSHYRIPSGDDDLFVNQVAKKSNTRVSFIPESHTVSTAKNTLTGWFYQKRRHFGTGRYYKKKHKFLLSFYYLSLLLFYALFIVLIFSQYNIYLLLSIFLIRMFSALFLFKKCMLRLEERNLLVYLPVFELFFLFFNPLVSLSAYIFKEQRWK